jgi:adenylate cyclase
MERKLIAILCADVHGYSRLMGDDEEATFRSLASHRKTIDALIEQHHGRFVNSAGDSVLAEFASVVNAVHCGIEIQSALKKENAELAPERRMEFRIGINLGDVIVDGKQIYGDGVNVAARLESLADPGGICISQTVHDQIGNKLALNYEDLGEQSVKNIAKPVRVFRLREIGTPIPRKTQRVGARSYLRGGAFSLAGLGIIAATIVLVQHLSLKPQHTSASIPPQQSRQQLQPLATVAQAPPLPSIPSIAVLPFTNLSRDPGQEYFSDGLTDALITSLSQLPGVFVIARNSSFFYKGKAVTVPQVGRELGVRMILQGSVLKAGNRIRINAQLARTIDGANVWAYSFDRPLQDVFAVQDDVVGKIVATLSEFFKLHNLKVPLGSGIGQSTNNLEAYDDFLRASEYYFRFTSGGNAKARELDQKAIELDPNYADAYASLGWTYSWAVTNQWTKHPEDDMVRASTLAEKALALDDSNLGALGLLSRTEWQERNFDQAIEYARRALALNPNYAYGYLFLGQALTAVGQPEKAIASLRKAIPLDPQGEDFYASEIGFAELCLGRYRAGVTLIERSAASYPNGAYLHLELAIAYAELGRDREARAQVAEVMRLDPQFKLPPPEEAPTENLALARRFDADLRRAGLK